jgi:hypothetical protein
VCFLLQDRRHQVGIGHDDIWRHANELSGERLSLVGVGHSPTNVDLDIAALDPTQFQKSLPERRKVGLSPSASPSGYPISKPTRRIRFDCCARAASGHTAVLLSKLTKSRRLIAAPETSGQGIVLRQSGRLKGGERYDS